MFTIDGDPIMLYYSRRKISSFRSRRRSAVLDPLHARGERRELPVVAYHAVLVTRGDRLVPVCDRATVERVHDPGLVEATTVREAERASLILAHEEDVRQTVVITISVPMAHNVVIHGDPAHFRSARYYLAQELSREMEEQATAEGF